ncbi:MAG: hypothetical protein J6Y32_01115 [Bacteroidales bacterium]|nr:hypothetical protein [Bacteroidales bacterium]
MKKTVTKPGSRAYETPAFLSMDLKAESAFLQSSETPIEGTSLPNVTVYELDW